MASRDKPVSVMGLRKEKLDKVLPKNLSFNSLRTIAQANKVYLHKNPKEGKETKPKLKKCVRPPIRACQSNKKIIRCTPFRAKTARKEYNDPLDRMILKKIGVKVRVKWTEKEDRVLLLCLAACIFLNPKHPKKQIVPYSTVRDVLHRVCPESRNKTSR